MSTPAAKRNQDRALPTISGSVYPEQVDMLAEVARKLRISKSAALRQALDLFFAANSRIMNSPERDSARGERAA